MKQKSIKINFLMNVILTISSLIFPLITFPYVSRILLPEGTGKVSFAISLITYFTMISQLGIPTYGIRICARVRDDREELSRTTQELFIISMIMAFISYTLLIVSLLTIPRLREERTLYIIVSSTILLSAIGMEWFYKALEQYTYITVRSIIFKLLSVIAMFILIHKKNDYIMYGAITVFASYGSMILNFFNVRKYIDTKPLGKYHLMRHMKPIMVFFAIAFSATIYTNMDIVLLGFLKTDAEVGYYNAAIRIKGVLVGIITSLGTVLLPRVSYYVEKGMTDEFTKITQKAMNFIFVSAIPLAVYFIIFAKPVVLFLAGNTFENSIGPMRVIMLVLPIVGVTNLFGLQILTPLGKEKYILFSNIVGALIDVIINILLIPKIGAIGAAIASLAAEAAVLIIEYQVLRKEIYLLFSRIQLIKILTGIFFGSIVSMRVLTLKIGNFFVIGLSAVLFFGITYIFLFVAKESFTTDTVRQIWNKMRLKSRHK